MCRQCATHCTIATAAKTGVMTQARRRSIPTSGEDRVCAVDRRFLPVLDMAFSALLACSKWQYRAKRPNIVITPDGHRIV